MIFWFKEAFKLIGRAKSSFILSFISTSIAVLLIVISVILIQLTGEFQSNIKGNVSINLFLKEGLSGNEIDSLKAAILENQAVKKVDFVSKDLAAEKFIKETGEDFRKILDYNPLPASFVVHLNESYIVKDSLSFLTKNLAAFPQVDEVVFEQKFIHTLLSYLEKFEKYIFIVTGILVLISIYLVYSTLKLIIYSKYKELETMKLVGAKLSTIKMPIILNGMLIGIFAGIFSLLIFVFALNYFDDLIGLKTYFGKLANIYGAILLFLGPLLGIMVSVFSLRKISLKI